MRKGALPRMGDVSYVYVAYVADKAGWVHLRPGLPNRKKEEENIGISLSL